MILKIYNAIYGIYINLYPPLNLINSDQSLYYSCNLFKLIELEGLLLVYYIVPCISYDTTTIYIIHLYFTIYWTLNIFSMKQTRKVSTNIFLEPAKSFFMAIHICQRQFLSNFFPKKSRVSKDNFLRFY